MYKRLAIMTLSGCFDVNVARDSTSLSDQLIRVPPFVVVPAHHLDQIAVYELRHPQIDGRCTRIFDDVARDNWIPGHTEDPAIASAAGFLDKNAVHFVGACHPRSENHDVGKGSDSNRSAHSDSTEPAAILRQCPRRSCRRAGGGGDEVRACCPTSSGPTVRGIDDGLTRGVRVNRRHNRFLYADAPPKNLHHGRDAVRCTTRARK